MKQHGVTNSADYSPEFYERKQTERKRKQERDGKRHRIELLKRQLER
jgi:ribosomal protein S21